MRNPTAIAICAVVLLTAATRGQDVQVRMGGEQLYVAAPALHFVSGKALESLRNGATVAYDVQVSVLSEGRQTVLRRAFERFLVSYDLWEERFSVTRMRTTRASVSHLTAQQAEAWCLDRLSVPLAGLPADRQLWVRLDVHARNGRDSQPLDDEGLSIGALIELFSRPGKTPATTQWRAESAAFTVAALRRAQSR